MNIGFAEQMVRDNPDLALTLLAEARASSGQALSELRALVRGIHPPTLVERGLDGAVRALRGIERRLNAFDGMVAVTSPAGGPTQVTMELPCELSSART
jgi:signal transduction histidine kinase